MQIDDIKPGMTAAVDVQDRRGRVLVAAGTALEEGHLRTLRMWGVAQVTIEGEGGADDDATQITPELRARVTEQLRQRFRQNDLEHPLVAALFEACLQRACLAEAVGASRGH